MGKSGFSSHPSDRQSVPPSLYDERYFLEECEGSALYAVSGGKDLSPRMKVALGLGGVRAGQTVIDLGCGRGEVAAACARAGAVVWGIDYAPAALSLARRALELTWQDGVERRSGLVCGNATRLPFRDSSVDVAFMLDLVEHLWPHELEATLAEVYRVLRPGARLVVHTMPNRWYYTFGYPIFRFYQRLRGHSLPADPRDRWEYVKHVHVNEQDVRSMARCLRSAGFRCKVWVASITASPQEGPFVRTLRRIMPFLYPANLLLGNDIFALANKPL